MATIIKKETPSKKIQTEIKSATQSDKKRDMMKLWGSLKSDVDPVEFQKKARDEWK